MIMFHSIRNIYIVFVWAMMVVSQPTESIFQFFSLLLIDKFDKMLITVRII